MAVTWVIETGIEPDYGQRLIASVQAAGFPYHVRKMSPFGEGTDPPIIEGPVIFHGSIQGSTWIREHLSWTPGAIEHPQAFFCRYYYPRLQGLLLNEEHLFLPFGEIHGRRRFLMDVLGDDGCLFMRPDSHRKAFTGSVVKVETWDQDIELLGFYDVPPEEMVVVCRPQNVTEEYRFWVVGGKLVTGSRYRLGENHDRVRVSPGDPIWKQADGILSKCLERGFNPDPAWVLDLGKSRQSPGLQILEVGPFSVCGLYAADTDILVREVSKVVQK